MTQYTLKQLSEEGPPFAMALLLRCLETGEPFVTYGAIRDELQHQLKIERIFSTHIGTVAGSLMDRILEVDSKAPLINVLITRGDGIPGKGVGGYLAERYGKRNLRKWSTVPRNEKLEIVEREREKVFAYKGWLKVNHELFTESSPIRLQTSSANTDPDISSGEYGGPAESEEHRELKEWVAKNPLAIGLRISFGEGKLEHLLMSGDEVDVMYQRGTSYRLIEVKSARSSDADLNRGIYQCVKYREVKRAEHAPFEIDCRSILVTERDLPEKLRERARVLNVQHKIVSRKP